MLPDYRVRQRDYLLEISRALTQELDLEKLLERILVISTEMLAGQAGLIALRSDEGRWTVASTNKIPPALTNFLEPQLAKVPDYADARQFELPEINRILQDVTRTVSSGLLTGVGLPLIVMERVIGVIFIFRNYPEIFSLEDKRLLQSFTDQAAIAVVNAKLYQQVTFEKQRLDALLDTAADGILILNADHSIERCNTVFEHLCGLPRNAIQGKFHNEIIHWARRPDGQTLEEAEQAGWPLTSNAHLYVEGDLARSEPPNIPVGITYAPLLTPAGILRNIIATRYFQVS